MTNYKNNVLTCEKINKSLRLCDGNDLFNTKNGGFFYEQQRILFMIRDLNKEFFIIKIEIEKNKKLDK